MARVQQPTTRSSTDRSPPVIPGDIQRLLNMRKIPARSSLFNLERPSMVDSTVPVATPAPIPHLTPIATPTRVGISPLRILQTQLTNLYGQIIPSELTMLQRRSAGAIPAPEAARELSGGAIWGLANFPRSGSGPVLSFIDRTINTASFGLLTPGVTSPRRIQVALESRSQEEINVPLTLRHEIGHQVLSLAGVPGGEHERLIAQAEPPGTTRGVNFGLLQMLIEGYKAPSAGQRRRFSRRYQQLAFYELRRNIRLGNR
jgi:hypothetical protein